MALIYLILFAATAGMAFAFTWRVMGATIELNEKPPKPRPRIHPEMEDVKNGETLLVFNAQPLEEEDDDDGDVIIVRR